MSWNDKKPLLSERRDTVCVYISSLPQIVLSFYCRCVCRLASFLPREAALCFFFGSVLRA